MEMNKKYDKYYLKRDPQSGYVAEDDGNPVLGECAKRDCPLESRHVKILNRSWKNHGVYYVEVKPVIKTGSKPKQKSEARLALELEANDLKIKFNPKIGDEKLQLKINEAKK